MDFSDLKENLIEGEVEVAGKKIPKPLLIVGAIVGIVGLYIGSKKAPSTSKESSSNELPEYNEEGSIPEFESNSIGSSTLADKIETGTEDLSNRYFDDSSHYMDSLGNFEVPTFDMPAPLPTDNVSYSDGLGNYKPDNGAYGSYGQETYADSGYYAPEQTYENTVASNVPTSIKNAGLPQALQSKINSALRQVSRDSNTRSSNVGTSQKSSNPIANIFGRANQQNPSQVKQPRATGVTPSAPSAARPNPIQSIISRLPAIPTVKPNPIQNVINRLPAPVQRSNPNPNINVNPPTRQINIGNIRTTIPTVKKKK